MYADVIEVETRKNHHLNSIAYINPKSSLFKEHFENFPILPGAFSLGLCIDILKEQARSQNNQQYTLFEIRKVSFLIPLKPGFKTKISLIKNIKRGKQITMMFSLNDESENKYVTGIIIFTEELS